MLYLRVLLFFSVGWGRKYILFSPIAEAPVHDDAHISSQHHQTFGLLVLVLRGTRPFTGLPFLVKEQSVVVVREGGGGEGPGAFEA